MRGVCFTGSCWLVSCSFILALVPLSFAMTPSGRSREGSLHQREGAQASLIYLRDPFGNRGCALRG
jgi:hypothetical protein